MCLGAIYWARLDRIFFASGRDAAAAAGFDDSFIYGQFQLDPELRRIPMIPVALEDALRPFQEWLRKSDRIAY
jgi:guanine deaminase